MGSSASSAPPPASGWAALPPDLLWSVFAALGQREVLSGAGLACVAWRSLARHEPTLWRRIDLTTPDDDVVEDDEDPAMVEDDYYEDFSYLLFDGEEVPSNGCDDDDLRRRKGMALAAVDRSAGQCEAFWGRVDDDVLLHLADRTSSIKSLRVTSYSYDVSSKVFAQVIKKFPLLEELDLVLKPQEPSTNSWVELFQSACEACSHLHHFKVRCAQSESHHLNEETSPTPFSILMMHGLRSLELCGGSFTKNVVLKIVDNCPNLESLNISNLPIDRWDDEIRYKCYRIKDLRLPSKCYDYDIDAYYSDMEEVS